MIAGSVGYKSALHRGGRGNGPHGQPGFVSCCNEGERGTDTLDAETLPAAHFRLSFRGSAVDCRNVFPLFAPPAHHLSPLDQLLSARATLENVAIVARDHEFKKYKGVRVIW